MSSAVEGFWEGLALSTDPAAYKPKRNEGVIAVRLSTPSEPYFVLKEPSSRSYLRLSEADYALWWQMNGRKSIKDLLYYSLVRYGSLPIGHLNNLVEDLRAGNFLRDQPANIYKQVAEQLESQDPASRGRRILNAFLRSELAVDGLDPFLSLLYGWTRPLFWKPVQLLMLLTLVFAGGFLYARLFWFQQFALTGTGGLSLISLLVANLVVIAVHELAHALTTKHVGRELNRGGFLLYWGMPAFFADTRDTWLSPRRDRIAVSWAGPHSGLLIGGLAGIILTAVALYFPEHVNSVWASFVFQLGFLAYVSVIINVNPLLELDGYFILSDALDLPGLRRSAIQFWRDKLWAGLSIARSPRRWLALWRSLERNERIFTLYGGLSLAYSLYALAFALYFWHTRLSPLVVALWTDYGWLGRMLVLLVAIAGAAPTVFYIVHFGWNRGQAGLEWLARRDLLERPDVLALLVGSVYLAAAAGVLLILSAQPNSELWFDLVVWLLHAAAAALLGAVARQVAGSRFQWVLWSLAAVPVGLAFAWIAEDPRWQDLGMIVASGAIFASGIVAWSTFWPTDVGQPLGLERSDRLLMAAFTLLGLLYAYGLYLLQNTLLSIPSLALLLVIVGMNLMAPLALNFWQSRFALPWLLMALAILATPLVSLYPQLYLPLISLWFVSALLYLLQGALTQFGRLHLVDEEPGPFHERERLVRGFNHFMGALFASYEAVMGGRRLSAIHTQMIALGPLDSDEGILQIATLCKRALALAVDRLDDLAGTHFTRQAGQAAYDSLPWLEAETLGRHVLSGSEWGAQLAQGFIQTADTRAELIRQADVFSGFDQAAVQEIAAVATLVEQRPGTQIAQAGREATRFFLIETGEVGVLHQGATVATLDAGGYFGLNALLESGEYQFTYQALWPTRTLVIERDRFDPLLRANTTLSGRISSGAETRQLLKQMPLFRGLSPQQLAAVDARLRHRHVRAGETIVSQGQSRSHLFIVASGQVEVSGADETGQRYRGVLGPGEHFGEYALFADTPYSATYRALVDSKLLALDEPAFDRLVAESTLMTHYVEQIGSSHLIATHRRPGLTAIAS